MAQVRPLRPRRLGYRNFPKSMRTSVNEVLTLGVPDDRALEEGDIATLEVGSYVDGYYGLPARPQIASHSEKCFPWTFS